MNHFFTISKSIDKIKIKYKRKQYGIEKKDVTDDRYKTGREIRKDKLKEQLKMTGDRFDTGIFSELLTQTQSIKEYQNLGGKIGTYRYMLTIHTEGEENSVFFAGGQYQPNGTYNAYEWWLEYNPNKQTVPDVIRQFLTANEAVVTEITSFDLAYDLRGTDSNYNQITVDSVVFDAPAQTQVMKWGTVAGDDTKYLRPKSQHGRVKVYDKEKERQNTPEAEQYKGVTRVEFSFSKCGYLLADEFPPMLFDRYAKEIFDLIQQIRVCTRNPENVNTEGMNGANVYAIQQFVRMGRADHALEFIGKMAQNSRYKYRKWLRENYCTGIEPDAIEFLRWLQKALRQTIPCGEIRSIL